MVDHEFTCCCRDQIFGRNHIVGRPGNFSAGRRYDFGRPEYFKQKYFGRMYFRPKHFWREDMISAGRNILNKLRHIRPKFQKFRPRIRFRPEVHPAECVKYGFGRPNVYSSKRAAKRDSKNKMAYAPKLNIS